MTLTVALTTPLEEWRLVPAGSPLSFVSFVVKGFSNFGDFGNFGSYGNGSDSNFRGVAVASPL